MGTRQYLFLPLLSVLALVFVAPSSSQTFLKILPEHIQSRSKSIENEMYCDSWRFSVETNDAGSWQTVPARCAAYVQDYMTGLRYVSDSEIVTADSLEFAERVAIGDGKPAWILDVDETLLTNMPYYELHGYGTEVYNETVWNDWVELARAPALPASLRLYNALKILGFRLVLLTGRGEEQRKATEENLRFAGYSSWDMLILRNATDKGKPAAVYKSEKRAILESEGYKIHGNSGDQWSDLFGSPEATRSFKLPNPMYCVT